MSVTLFRFCFACFYCIYFTLHGFPPRPFWSTHRQCVSDVFNQTTWMCKSWKMARLHTHTDTHTRPIQALLISLAVMCGPELTSWASFCRDLRPAVCLMNPWTPLPLQAWQLCGWKHKATERGGVDKITETAHKKRYLSFYLTTSHLPRYQCGEVRCVTFKRCLVIITF